MAQIRLNGEEMKQYGSEIQAMGEDFAQIIADIKKTVDTIADCWDGLAADSYEEVYTATEKTLLQLEPAVRGIGQTVMDIAETWIQTEQKLASSNG